jgi:hypothetical protein
MGSQEPEMFVQLTCPTMFLVFASQNKSQGLAF